MLNLFARCSCFPPLDEEALKLVLLKPDDPKDLTRDQMQRIERLHAELIEIEPLRLEDWIFGFELDDDPEQAIRTHETALFVLRKLDAMTKLTLELQTKVFRTLISILMDHRCVDPQRDICGDLPDWQTILDMCRQARESYATWCES